MVTGDNIVTAKNIGKNCGIYQEGVGIAMEGPQFRQLDEAELLNVIKKLQVLARSSPTDKQLLVKTIKESGEVVAVTGDGTNDAPALKLASVGFAMGISGTEVAREAADVVLMDDNFASIVKAIMWGRNVFDGIRSFLQFQLTVNFVGGLLTLIGALSNTHSESPLTAVQLLWINLIMDTFAALALATQMPTEDLLDYAPYGPNEPLISPLMWRRIIGQGLYQLAVNFTLLYVGDQMFDVKKDGVEHMTIIFNTFVWCQIFNMVNARVVHHKLNIFNNIFANWLFFGVMAFEVVIQVLFVELGGGFTSTTSLYEVESAWPGCILIGAGSLPVGLLINLLPFTERRGNSSPLLGEKQDDISLDEVKYQV
jgi:Ca2+-transporting ATPase